MGSSRVREPLGKEIQEEKGLGRQKEVLLECVCREGRLVEQCTGGWGGRRLRWGRTFIRDQGAAYRDFRYKPYPPPHSRGILHPPVG